MYIYYCDKCKSLESFSGAEEEWKCKECGSDFWPLGVTIDEWNAMTNEQMLDTINFAQLEYEKKTKKYDYSNVADEPAQPKPDVRVDLMECPDCYKMISPKSTKCPHCGHYFVNNPKAVRRRKAKRKLALQILLIGLIPVLLGGIYEAIILSGKVLEGEMTLLRATGSNMLYLVQYGGFAFVAIGLAMIIFGLVGIIANKPYLAEKIKEDDWYEGVVESGVVIRDNTEDTSIVREVKKPVVKQADNESAAGISERMTSEGESVENVELDAMDTLMNEATADVPEETEEVTETSAEESVEVVGEDYVEAEESVDDESLAEPEDNAAESTESDVIDEEVQQADDDAAVSTAEDTIEETIEETVEEAADADMSETDEKE